MGLCHSDGYTPQRTCHVEVNQSSSPVKRTTDGSVLEEKRLSAEYHRLTHNVCTEDSSVCHVESQLVSCSSADDIAVRYPLCCCLLCCLSCRPDNANKNMKKTRVLPINQNCSVECVSNEMKQLMIHSEYVMDASSHQSADNHCDVIVSNEQSCAVSLMPNETTFGRSVETGYAVYCGTDCSEDELNLCHRLCTSHEVMKWSSSGHRTDFQAGSSLLLQTCSQKLHVDSSQNSGDVCLLDNSDIQLVPATDDITELHQLLNRDQDVPIQKYHADAARREGSVLLSPGNCQQLLYGCQQPLAINDNELPSGDTSDAVKLLTSDVSACSLLNGSTHREAKEAYFAFGKNFESCITILLWCKVPRVLPGTPSVSCAEGGTAVYNIESRPTHSAMETSLNIDEATLSSLLDDTSACRSLLLSLADFLYRFEDGTGQRDHQLRQAIQLDNISCHQQISKLHQLISKQQETIDQLQHQLFTVMQQTSTASNGVSWTDTC